jgi:hypothetical protein
LRKKLCSLIGLALFLAITFPAIAQQPDHFIDSLLRTRPAQFGKILKNVNRYEVQIIYTQVHRDKNNQPSLKHYTYRLGKNYFYPASLVKLPCSILALEKLNDLSIQGLDMNTAMLTDSSKSCPLSVKQDTTSENKLPSIAHYIKRMLLVSDNFSYNRIYEFLGQEHISKRLQELGYNNARIVHSFDGGCPDGKQTSAVSFVDTNGDTIYRQPEQPNNRTWRHPLGTVNKGRAHLDNKDRYIKTPKDYTNMNYLPLQDVHNMVISVIFPELLPKEQRPNLTKDDLDFLRTHMGMYPRESDFPQYDPKKYEDSHKKYLLYGTHHKPIESDSVRIFNIVGQSYGDLSDCAYIRDKEKGIEFFLSAVIYVNSDGVINDGKYDYKTIGFPFMADLGRLFYEYERGL